MAKREMYPRKVQQLVDDDSLYALVDETVRGDDGDGGYTTDNYIQIIHLGNREQAHAWVMQQEESARRYGPATQYKIVTMKELKVHRTIEISLE